MEKTIFKQVYYDWETGKFYYQIAEYTPLCGPFEDRESAVADAKWNINKGGGSWQ